MNNQITTEQWNELVELVQRNAESEGQPAETVYLCTTHRFPDIRHSCYDNYDRVDSPGLDFVTTKDSNTGRLSVYNGSEQAKAPITLDEGKRIAANFFNITGSQLAEEIVVEYVDSPIPRYKLFG